MRTFLAVGLLTLAIGCQQKPAGAPEQPGAPPELPNTPNGAPTPPQPSAPSGNDYTNEVGMQFVRVPKGTLWSPWGRHDIPNDYYIGVYEVTQHEWQAVTGKNPSYFSATGKGAAQLANVPPEELRRFPVESVSWPDAQDFCARLNAKHAVAGWRYRLPSQREWEYAARGAEQDKAKAQHFFHFKGGLANTLTTRQANFGKLDWLRLENVPGCLGRTCRVGSYEPNPLGLYDVHGNVAEWCEDIHTPPGKDRVQGGGSYVSKEMECSAGARGRGDHTLRAGADDGVRVVLAPVPTTSVPSPVVNDKPQPPAKTDPGLSRLTALGLVGMLKADKSAENRYKNKPFLIDGTVAQLDDEHSIVTLTGSKVASVRCFFAAAARADFAQLKVGQKITVMGTLSGTSATGDAQLLMCEVAK